MDFGKVRRVIYKAVKYGLEVLEEGLFPRVRVERTKSLYPKTIEEKVEAIEVSKILVIPQEKSPSVKGSAYYEIRSPFIGTFYWNQAKVNRPLIKRRSRVEEGQTLGIIFDAYDNKWGITSPYTGVIKKVYVRNEHIVTEGELMFGIEVKNPGQ